MATGSGEKTLTRLLLGCGRYRYGVWGVLALLLLLAGVLLWRVADYANDITALLAPGSASARSFELLRQCGLSDTVQLEFTAGEGPIVARAADLDACAAALRRVPGVKRVDFRYADEAAGAGDLAALRRRVPELAIDGSWQTPENARRIALRMRKMLMAPVGGSSFNALAGDATGAMYAVLNELDELRKLAGLKLDWLQPFPVGADGRRALLRLETTVSCADAEAGMPLLAAIRQTAVRHLPADVSLRLTAPHFHSIDNARLLQRDIAVVSVLSLVFLGVVFIVVYRRDVRSFWIPVLPLAASVLVLGAMSLVFDRIYYFIVGMGGGIVGLAVDQGIHIYAARSGVMGWRRIGRLVRPLWLGALTSAGVFGLLMLTGIPAYAQLGCFAGGSLALSLVLMLTVLPALQQRQRRAAERRPGGRGGAARRYGKCWIGLFVLLLAGGAAAWLALPVNFDLKVFDAADASRVADEQAMAAYWYDGAQTPALLLCRADSVDGALAGSRRLADELRAAGVRAVGAGLIWPENAERRRRKEIFIQGVRAGGLARFEADLKRELTGLGLPGELSAEVVAPWREGVALEPDAPAPGPAALALAQLVRAADGGQWIGMVMMEDSDRAAAVAGRLIQDRPELGFVSQRGFAGELRRDLAPRILGLLAAAGAGVLLAAWLFFRSLKPLLLAMAPVAGMFSAVLVVLWLGNMQINLIVSFALVILTGLAIDYGIFGVYALRGEHTDSLRRSMTISALTTLAAAASLGFARHPILFQTGVVLGTGILTAYGCAMLVLPALAVLKFRRKTGVALTVPAGMLLLALMAGCRTETAENPAYPQLEISADQARAELSDWRKNQSGGGRIAMRGIMEYRQVKFPLLALGKFNAADSELDLAALTPAGIKVYELHGGDGQLKKFELAAFFPDASQATVARTLFDDWQAIWFDNAPECPAALEVRRRQIEFEIPVAWGGSVRYVFAGRPLRLVEKSARDLWREHWRLVFGLDGWRLDDQQRWVMQQAEYWNRTTGYRVAVHE